MSVTFEVTLHLRWFWGYLAAGAVLWLPMTWLAWSHLAKITGDPGFFGYIARQFSRYGWVGSTWRIVIQVALWPVVVYEEADYRWRR